MNLLRTLLTWLSGKKSVIATILMGAVAYGAAKEYLGEPEVAFATVVIAALFGTTSYITGKVVYNK